MLSNIIVAAKIILKKKFDNNKYLQQKHWRLINNDSRRCYYEHFSIDVQMKIFENLERGRGMPPSEVS